jgi:hypothetical protein
MFHRTLSPVSLTFRTALGLVLGGMLVTACADSGVSSTAAADGSEVIDGDRLVFQGVSKRGALSAEELRQFVSDRAYVQRLVPAGVPATLNHADPQQHRFVLARLKMAGKTPENSPELFKMIDDVRHAHMESGLGAGTIRLMSGSSDIENLHYFNDVSVGGDDLNAVASASVTDDLYFGYMDAVPWDAEGNQIGDLAYTEVYGNMPYQHVGALGDLSLTSDTDLEVDSFLIKDSVQGGYQETYVWEPQSRDPGITVPLLNSPVIIAPLDVTGDSCVSVCLNRTWTGDCDYDLTGSVTAFKLPLKGSISLNKAGATFDQGKIDEYKAGTAVDTRGAADAGGQMRVVLTNVGGGCNVDAGQALYAGMQSFWQRTTLSSDKRTLSWDMTGAYAALFDDSCRQVQDQVELSMNVKLPYKTSTYGSVLITNVFMTNKADAPAAQKVYPACLKITNSCLAAGTLIEMPSGGLTPIESIQSGDEVFNPYDRSDLALTVADTAKGFETVPMVRIVDEAGRSLLMTEMHPIQVANRGMVMAKYLSAGDVVTTKEGPSRLSQVTREKYDGSVYNLKVGRGEETQALGQDQTVMYANGFLVGDGQIQSKYESIELSNARRTSGPVRLPARWRADYQNSARR